MYARTILRKPNPNKFNKDDLAKVAVTPWSLHVPKVDEVIFRDPKVSEQDDFKEKPAIARQVTSRRLISRSSGTRAEVRSVTTN